MDGHNVIKSIAAQTLLSGTHRRWLTVILLNGMLCAWLLLKPVPETYIAIVDGIVCTLLPLLGSIWSIPWHFRSMERHVRWTMTCFSIGILFFTAGQFLYYYFSIILHESPFPSPADFCYIAAYPFLIIGVLILPASRRGSILRSRVFADSVIATTAVAAFSWFFLIGPMVTDPTSTPLAKALAIAYPLLDLVILFALLLNAEPIVRSGRHILLALTFGLISIIAADSIFGYRSIHGTWVENTAWDVLWPLGYLLVGLGGGECRRLLSHAGVAGPHLKIPPFLRVLRQMAMAILVILASCLVVYAEYVECSLAVERGVQITVLLLIIFVVLRQFLAILDNAMLNMELRKTLEELQHNHIALQQSKKRFQRLTEQMVDAVFVRSLDGRLIEVNQQACASLGYSPAELLSLNIWDIDIGMSPDVISDNNQRLQAPASRPIALTMESTHRRKDGSTFPVELRIAPIELDGQTVVLAVARDATERKRAEAVLREDEQRFRQLIEQSVDAVFVHDFQGHFIEVNPRACESLGYTRQEILRMSLLDIEISVSPEQILVLQKELFNTKPGTPPVMLEGAHRRKDGSTFPVEVRAGAIEIGGQRFIHSVVRDITIRKQQQEQLRLAHEQLELRVQERTSELTHANRALHRQLELTRAITHNVAEGICAFDSSGLVTFINPAACKLLGNTEKQLLGANFHSIVHPQRGNEEPHKTEDCELMQLFETKQPILEKDIEFTAGYGKKITATCSAVPLTHEGELQGYVLAFRDTTAQRQNELALRRAMEQAECGNKAKSEFLAKMSHEIRTPLAGVIGMTELLLDTNLSSEQIEYAKTAQNSAESLLELINDILDFSKIEAGRLEIEHIDFELHQVVENAITMLAPKAGAKKIDIASFVDSQVPTCLRGDPARLRQILVNFVTNGIKFTQQGEVLIHCDIEDQQAGKVILKFSVTDTGIGIPPDRIDRLFKSFSQVDSSTTRQYGGTGLGLAICKQLAELMGGKVGVNSEVGKGSTFWFTLPFEVNQDECNRLEPAVDPQQLRVLVVSPSAAQRSTLHAQLTKWNIPGATAATADEALYLLRQKATTNELYSVMMVDSALPASEQMPLVFAVQSDPTLIHTALVLLTPLQAPLTEAAITASGFVAQVPKPVRQSQLLDHLMEALAHFQGQSQRSTQSVSHQNHETAKDIALKGAHVLIVEDNPINQQVARRYLDNAGCTYKAAANGREAVELALHEHFDLVLMDCQMPVMDGFEATKQIREAENLNRLPGRSCQQRLPIVALTANAIRGDREYCLAAGMDDYLSKPLRQNALVQMLKSRLGQSSAPAEQAGLSSDEKIAHAVANPPTSSDIEPVDYKALLDNFDGNHAFLNNIANIFRRQIGGEMKKLTDAIAAKNGPEARTAAHSIKGIAGLMAARPANLAAAKIEELTTQGEFDQVPEVLSSLRMKIDEVLNFLDQHVPEQPNQTRT